MTSPGNINICQLREEVLKSKLVGSWFKQAVPSLVLNDIHGSKSTAFETVMGKLTDFGIGKGTAELDQYTLPYREWLSDNIKNNPEHIFNRFSSILIEANRIDVSSTLPARTYGNFE